MVQYNMGRYCCFTADMALLRHELVVTEQDTAALAQDRHQ